MIPPKLERIDKDNFETLLRAAKDGNLAIISAIRISDQQPVVLIVAVSTEDDGSFRPVPFAEMIQGNPYVLYEDPTLDAPGPDSEKTA